MGAAFFQKKLFKGSGVEMKVFVWVYAISGGEFGWFKRISDSCTEKIDFDGHKQLWKYNITSGLVW